MIKTSNLAARYEHGVVRQPGCWGWRLSNRHGYGQIVIDKVHWSAHRLSWTIHHGPITNGLQVLHRCNNPVCSNPEHLYLGTDKENAADRRAAGTCSSPFTSGHRLGEGEYGPAARLTNAEVRSIRTLYRDWGAYLPGTRPGGASLRSLGTCFGVGPQQIDRIIKRSRRTFLK